VVLKRLFASVAPQRRICRQKCFPFISPGGCSLPPDLVCARWFSPSHALISPGSYCSAQTSSSIKKSHLTIRQLLGCDWRPLICSDVPTKRNRWKRNDLPTHCLSRVSWPWQGPRGWCPSRRSWMFAADLSMFCCREWQQYGRNVEGLVPSASLSAPIICYASGFCCSQRSSSEMHIAKNHF